MKIQWQYLVTIKSRRDIIGLRYFKWSPHTDSIVQVTKSAGEMKRGKGNLYGVSIVSRLTLFSNYVALGYVSQCTKKEFDRAFNDVVESLR